MRRRLLDSQDDRRTKQRRVQTSVDEAVKLDQALLRSADVSVNNVPLSEGTVTTGGEFTEFAAELDKAKARIVKLEPVKTITVRRHEEVLDEVKKRYAEEICVWKETSAENSDYLINDVKVAKVGSVKMSVERNSIFTRFEEHVLAL